ncbi:MAG: hypothetical protein KBE04_00960 [Phycisphaerae bacterium]|nr:hypothetical protein [Phycisphaerae bacterium]
MLHRRPILAVWVVTLLMAGASAAEEGSRFGVKAGVQTLTSPVTGGKTTRTRLELEFSTARLLDGHVDLALALGGSSLGTLRDASMTEEDGLFTDASSIDDLCVLDLRLAAHYYPLGQDDRGLTPYLGAGLGYFLFIDTWQDTVFAWETDPFAIVTYTITGRTDTVAEGFFTFLMAGLTVSLGEHAELLAEVAYDFSKQDRGHDLGGPIYLIGGRYRW